MPSSLFVAAVLSASLAIGGLLVWSIRLRRRIDALQRELSRPRPAVPCAETEYWRELAASEQEQLARLSVQLRETQGELASLTYSISHDVRAPLRGIDGFSQALAEDYAECLDGTGHDYLRRIRAGATQLNLLIEDLLTLSRIVRAPFRPERVDLSALVTAAMTELSAAEPMRQMHWDIQPGLSAQCDRALVDVALRHLLVNAWKFTAGRIAARISFRVLDSPGSDWPSGATVFEVRDNGAGFDMQYAGKLFGAFQKMHVPEDFPGGRGIGLATVQRIVARHGGTVRADATPGGGAAFAFTLCGATVKQSAVEPGSGQSIGGLLTPGIGTSPTPKHPTNVR